MQQLRERMSTSLASWKPGTGEFPEYASHYCNIEMHVPNLAARVMLTLLSAVHEYSYPTRTGKDSWGFAIIHHASPRSS